MDYYYKEWEKLQEEFHDVMHEYPLFSEMIQDIEDKDIKELNELLEKNDEYYLKKAISKLKDLISYIKDTSLTIKSEFTKFDELALAWEKVQITNVSIEELNEINRLVRKANELIKRHSIKDIKEANKIMTTLINDNK